MQQIQEIQRVGGIHRAGAARWRAGRPTRVGRLAVGGAVAGALAFGAAGAAGFAGAATTTTTTPGHGGFGHRGFAGGPGGFGGGGGGFGAAGGFAPGGGAFGSSLATPPAVGGQSVTAVGDGSLSVSGTGGTTRMFDTTSSTTYTIDGTPASASAVSVGSKVTVRTAPGPRSFPGNSGTSTTTTTPVTPTATAVNVVLPELTGTVSALGSGSITLTDSQGFWRTAKISGPVTYLQSGEPATSSGVVVGSQVTAIGTIDANHTDLDASIVDVILPVVTGKVTAVSGSTITLQPYTGSATTTVDTTSGTVFVNGGSPNAGPGSLGALKAGDVISASGTKAADGTVTAVKVTLFGAPGSPGGFPAARGPGGAPAGTSPSAPTPAS